MQHSATESQYAKELHERVRREFPEVSCDAYMGPYLPNEYLASFGSTGSGTGP